MPQGEAEGRILLFVNKKKQKKFVTFRPSTKTVGMCIGPNGQKLFGSLFFRKEHFPAFCPLLISHRTN